MRPFLARLVPAALLLALAPSASAHFIWIHVVPGSKPRIEVLFGDGVHQDTDPTLARYVEGLEIWSADGQPLQLAAHPWGLDGDLAPGVDLVAARKDMGLFQRPGQDTAVALHYSSKGAASVAAAGRELGLETELLAAEEGGELLLSVRFRGSPAPGATVFASRFDAPGLAELTADEQGRVRVPRPPRGVFHAKARVVVPQAGERGGEPYSAEHHYAILTISDLGPGGRAPAAELEAWQRLEEAHRFAARLPADVAGLAGVLSVSLDGAGRRGEFEFAGGRLVQCDVPGLAEEDRAFVAAELEDLLLPLFERDFAAGGSALALAPRDGHPLGRRIDGGDPAHTTYYVREGEVTGVETTLGGERRVRQVLQSGKTEAGLFYPTHVARCALDAESQALLSSETTQDEFRERDGLLLPTSRRALVARDGLCRSAEIKLSNLEVDRVPPPAAAAEAKAPAGG